MVIQMAILGAVQHGLGLLAIVVPLRSIRQYQSCVRQLCSGSKGKEEGVRQLPGRSSSSGLSSRTLAYSRDKVRGVPHSRLGKVLH